MAQWKNLSFTGNPVVDAEINRRFRYAFENIDIAQILFKLNDIEGTLSLPKGGTGAVLVAPAGDRLMFYDLSANSVSFLDIGGSLKITDTTMDTAQDIRSTASPTFAGLTLTGLTGILKAASGTISAVTGLTQTITIPDTDGINYHHLEFTDGILTGYEKDTNL